MKRTALLLLLCAPAMAGLFSPPLFIPVTHPDGSQTWTYSIAVSDIPKAERDRPDLAEWLAGFALAHNSFCSQGWSVSDSRTEKNRVIIEGRCKSADSRGAPDSRS